MTINELVADIARQMMDKIHLMVTRKDLTKAVQECTDYTKYQNSRSYVNMLDEEFASSRFKQTYGFTLSLLETEDDHDWLVIAKMNPDKTPNLDLACVLPKKGKVA